MPETWNFKPETWNFKPETSNMKLQTCNLKPETSNLKPETWIFKPEALNLKQKNDLITRVVSHLLLKLCLENYFFGNNFIVVWSDFHKQYFLFCFQIVQYSCCCVDVWFLINQSSANIVDFYVFHYHFASVDV